MYNLAHNKTKRQPKLISGQDCEDRSPRREASRAGYSGSFLKERNLEFWSKER